MPHNRGTPYQRVAVAENIRFMDRPTRSTLMSYRQKIFDDVKANKFSHYIRLLLCFLWNKLIGCFSFFSGEKNFAIDRK